MIAPTDRWAAVASPMVGKADIRKRAAPIGTSVTVSSGWSEMTGLSGKVATSPYWSSVHWGILRAFAVSASGTSSSVKGKSLAGQGRFSILNEPAGSRASNSSP